MAQRRMFSLKIIDTDAFLDMPQSSQLLYFHLSLRADDDGFVSNPKKIMRITRINEDDLKVLVAKQFVIPFKSGVCVIRHWKIHNYIQSDRYNETLYTNEKAQLSEENNGVYALDTTCIQSGDTGKASLGKSKDSLKPSKSENQKVVNYTSDDMRLTELLIQLIQRNNPEWKMRGNKDTWAEHINKLHRLDERTYEQIEVMIKWTQQDSFWSQNILSTSKLREKFNDLIPRLKGALQKSGSKKQIFI